MGGLEMGTVTAAPLQELTGFREQPGDVLPVSSVLRELLPAGLRRGSTVSITQLASGATSLLLMLAAEVPRAGWCAVVGVPELGAVAAEELGVALDRLAVVPEPGRAWPAVVAALLDGVDVVMVRPPRRPAARDVRRLAARTRERGAVLIAAGPWEGAELRLTVTASRWHGVGAGHGHLRGRELRVRAEGRASAARPHETTLWLPAPEPEPRPVEPGMGGGKDMGGGSEGLGGGKGIAA